jgi:hypothetical protein
MRVFNALNGEEVKKILKSDFAKLLDMDSELARHLTFPVITWRITVEMEIYPRTPKEKIIAGTGTLEEVDPNTSQPVDVTGLTARKIAMATEERRIDAPDQAREEEGIARVEAKPQITFARRAEVGTGALNPTIASGNRQRG